MPISKKPNQPNIIYQTKCALPLPAPLRKIFHYFGGLLTSFSVASLALTYYPLLRTNYLRPKPIVAQPNTPQVESSLPAPFEVIKAEAASYGLNSRFSIAIPKLQAFSNIVPFVDPFDEQSYQTALKEGVAHAKGSSLPGQGKTIYLFAHSTNSPTNVIKYNAIFYKLRDLEMGDKITIFYKDDKYLYEVFDIKVVSAEETNWLNNSQPENLILQTCDPPGTSLRRLLVIAKLV
jgi:LPXTG-site transpeptidase (sortase) family protein